MPTFDFTAPDGTKHSIEGPEGATREQAFQMLQLKLGGQSEPSRSANDYVSSNFPEESLASDTAKSIGSGLEQGTAAAIGLPGNIASTLHSLAPQSVIDKIKAIPGAKLLYDHLPTSQAVLDSASEPMVDPNYQPQHAANRYTQAIAANAGPGLATGMGPLATVGSAIAGQGAYDLTGSHLAEAGASLAGGIGPGLIKAIRARQAIQPLLNAREVKDVADTQYANPLIRDTTINPQATGDLAYNMQQELANSRSRFAPAQAPAVHNAVNGVAEEALQTSLGQAAGHNVPDMSIEDLHSLRKTLGKIGQETRDFKPTEQATAAGTAKRVLDHYLDNVPSKDVVQGNPIDAVQALRDANANWRFGNSAEKVGNIIQKAIDTAGTQGSGMNYGNLQRKGLLPLLDNDAAKLKQMGFGSPEDIDAVRTASTGDFKTNLSRRASNMLGGGGGIASTAAAALTGKVLSPVLGGAVGGEEGYRHGGFLGGLTGAAAGAATGHTLRAIANARTMRAVKDIQNAILAKAPANAGIVASNDAARAANSAAMKKALLNNAARTAPIVQDKINKPKRIYIYKDNGK